MIVRKIALVVEGLGDRKSFPSLVAKTAEQGGQQVFVRKVIEAGDWPKLKREGSIEKYCRLAAIGQGVDQVIVAVDLDDGCAKVESEFIKARLVEIEKTIGCKVSVVFAIREYEGWFLENLADIKAASADIAWTDRPEPVDGSALRDAKGEFEMHLGASYRPSIDQDKFTKRLNLANLKVVSRSYRKFMKEVTGVGYAEVVT